MFSHISGHDYKGPLTHALSITGFRKEVLLGLGRTSKKAALTVAFTLARRYTFPEYLVRPLLAGTFAHTSYRAPVVRLIRPITRASGGSRELGAHLAQPGGFGPEFHRPGHLPCSSIAERRC